MSCLVARLVRGKLYLPEFQILGQALNFRWAYQQVFVVVVLVFCHVDD